MTNSFGNFQAQWSNQNQFWAWMDSNGNVYASDNMSGTRQIGVSVEKYKQMESIANEATAKAEDYHAKLVEAGIIVVPPTPEEQIAQLTAQVAKLTQIIESSGVPQKSAITPEQPKTEGKNNGHLGNGESPAPQGQPVVGKDRPSTAVSLPASAVPVGPGAVNGAVRKIETRRS